MPNLDPKTLGNLSSSLRSTAFRRSFSVDPINTLARVGIDTKELSPDVIDALADLSSTELDTLSKLQKRFEGSEDLAEFTGGVIF